MCITTIAINNTLTWVTEVGTSTKPQHTSSQMQQPKLKRRRIEKRRNVFFNETVIMRFVEVTSECSSIEKKTWYNSQEIKHMKRNAFSKDVVDSPSCRSDHVYKLLNEIGVDNFISSTERRRSCKRRVGAYTAVLKEQLRQLSFDGKLDSKLLAESYKELSTEATLESMRLALADEIVAGAIMAGL